MGVSFEHSRVFVSDRAPHFKNETPKLIATRLGTSRRFPVAYSSWSNGIVERMNLEVVRTFRAVMSERGRPLSEWPDTINAVQFALNSACRERMGATLFQLMTGRVPRTVFSVFAGDGPDGWCMKEEESSPEMMQKSVAGWVTVQEELRREVVKCVRAARDRKRLLPVPEACRVPRLGTRCWWFGSVSWAVLQSW